ncbi:MULTISPECIES: NADP-dependent oxidoreductase [Rhodococcus]|uniref:NADP-dependent oxidoreductase n=1 Tax=Rhodococcus oxybenzonivorans TaxID=1990687 RepID=A0AAE5A5R7_9NOCA|nr:MULTISPECIES: NADP-dependent oxidoreductase [Rhodococcus]MDV7243629.1 NADP-dependent oxidoreductase [Rhodococcus oxybenzonivorans]MDV7264308.1 NADP-dependent oxidoreductase [Rhodococcus oxybenzonivorans]MDV7275129.1 NADP-dependent oxidoreductase [Rhodococcus oxybenzonivorans]MDV7335367.1 NADP-dependent oxidoreductase [Rhodococcus oxybenzonivorans]MDV7346078.1 NADP-dependent oxidoreductase [Rhodococcus oxybenzonivorans]
MNSSQQIVLAQRPHGQVSLEDFRVEDVALPELQAGDVALETLFISIDPAIRGWLDDRPSYLPPVAIGEPVRAFGLARVSASRNSNFTAGDIVRGFVGWQRRQIVNSPGTDWDRITSREDVPLEHYLGILGMTGLTAWAGVCDILRPEPGHTVLISGASGAVGSVAVQLAKQTGARVVGIAGGAEKCSMVARLGADAVIDRKAPDWKDQLEAATTDGIDRLFENSGGPMFDASITRLNNHAHIALCGLIDGYNLTERPAGPHNFGQLLTKRILTQGFIVLDYMDRAAEVEATLGKLHKSGQLEAVQSVLPGFEQLPAAFVDSFSHGQPGKIIIDLTA